MQVRFCVGVVLCCLGRCLEYMHGQHGFVHIVSMETLYR